MWMIKKILYNIIQALIKCGQNIVYPVHPRTKKRLQEFGFYNKLKNAKNISLIEPLGYFDTLLMMKKCNFILTDSGGIQEEATSPKIRKKVLVLRKTTDRPEAVNEGFSEIVELSQNKILKSIKRNSLNPNLPKKSSPYGTGSSAKKILKTLKNL